MTPLDWFTAGYCIANSSPSSQWALEYEHEHIHTLECLQLLDSGIKHQSSKKGGTIYSFALTAGDKLLQCLEAFLDLSHHIENLSELIIGGILYAGRKTINTLEYIVKVCALLKRVQISTDDSLENWSTLINGLPQLPSLTIFEVEAQFSTADSSLLNAILPQCHSLKHLTVWFNEDSSGSTSHIVGISPLATNHLESLNVQCCRLTKDALKALAEAIESPNCSISSLRLQETSVAASDFSILAQSIATNSSIKSLTFSESGIDDTAIICLATAISVNQSLEEIEVMEWYMSNDTEKLLKQCADSNPKIKSLKVPPRNLPQEFLNLYHLNPNK